MFKGEREGDLNHDHCAVVGLCTGRVERDGWPRPGRAAVCLESGAGRWAEAGGHWPERPQTGPWACRAKSHYRRHALPQTRPLPSLPRTSAPQQGPVVSVAASPVAKSGLPNTLTGPLSPALKRRDASFRERRHVGRATRVYRRCPYAILPVIRLSNLKQTLPFPDCRVLFGRTGETLPGRRECLKPCWTRLLWTLPSFLNVNLHRGAAVASSRV